MTTLAQRVVDRYLTANAPGEYYPKYWIEDFVHEKTVRRLTLPNTNWGIAIAHSERLQVIWADIVVRFKLKQKLTREHPDNKEDWNAAEGALEAFFKSDTETAGVICQELFDKELPYALGERIGAIIRRGLTRKEVSTLASLLSGSRTKDILEGMAKLLLGAAVSHLFGR
jgi:hypothetical protein